MLVPAAAAPADPRRPDGVRGGAGARQGGVLAGPEGQLAQLRQLLAAGSCRLEQV